MVVSERCRIGVTRVLLWSCRPRVAGPPGGVKSGGPGWWTSGRGTDLPLDVDSRYLYTPGRAQPPLLPGSGDAGRDSRVSTTDVSSEIDDLRRRLIEQAEVYDSSDYEAGVLDALDAVSLLLDDEPDEGAR